MSNKNSHSELSDAEGNAKNVVQSLAKGFRILEVFTADARELRLSEIARRAGCDNATAFRFVNTLVMLGYLERAAEPRHFRLTLKCLDLGFNAIARTDLRDLADPLLRKLTGETAEAASLGVLDGADVVYIHRVQAGLARLGVDMRVGGRVPAYCSGIGRAILAFLPRAQARAVIAMRPLRALTERTVTEPKAIERLLDETHARGFAISEQEVVPGLRVLAAPVLDAGGGAIAAVSVAAPAIGRGPDAFVKAIAPQLVETARRLTRALAAAGGALSSSSEQKDSARAKARRL